jgi:ADP-ribose pyrophosphatase YjhB (NUDIX family)
LSWPPEITVAAIVTRNDTFLMVEEIDHGDLVINQPAGHLEPNESLVEAMMREVLEETSYLTRPEAIIGFYQFQAPNDGPLYFRICYLARVIEKTQQALDPDIQAALWLTQTDIMQRKHRSPLVARCLQDYQNGHRIPLEHSALILS